MQTGPDVLRTTDWTRTLHAHGSGSDVPAHLALLLTGDAGERTRALDYLHSAIVHQGTVYTATVPVALFVAGILERPELGDQVQGPVSEAAGTGSGHLRHALLGFLTRVAEGALRLLADGAPGPALPSEAGPDRVYAALTSEEEALMHRAGEDMRAAAPALHEAVRPLLTHHDALTRIRAVEVAAALTRLGGLELDLSGAADMAESRDEGAAIVLALGASGADTTEFLTHADPAIRACAALAPRQRGNPAATGELVAALTDPAGADTWFTVRPAFFDGHVRPTLVRALADRSGPQDAGRLLPVLRAVAPPTPSVVAEWDAGPLFALAFPPRDGAEGARAPVRDPESLTDVQRAYLRVLLEADGCWDGRTANPRVVLARLGLPRDREGIRALLDP